MTNEASSGIDYGPLAALIGTWQGGKGLDISPEPDGSEKTGYYETIVFEGIGDVTNAEAQTLVSVRYHQVVHRASDDMPFHNETGYWMWDAERNTVMHSLTIPRAICVLAGGEQNSAYSQTTTELKVSAAIDDPDWGVIQSPFMKENARTVKFDHTISVAGDELSYSETTIVDIYGKIFDHTDSNVLRRSQ